VARTLQVAVIREQLSGPAIIVGVAGAPFALIGLLLYEHAYVQAGQSVPLA